MRIRVRLAVAIGVLCLSPLAGADDRARLAPCVQRLAQADEAHVVPALAAVRRKGAAVVRDLRRAIKQYAGDEVRWARLRRALQTVTEDWQRARTPDGMVYVPAGPVEVSRTTSPFGPSGKRQNVPAFYIDRTETTVEQWTGWCQVLAKQGVNEARWCGPAIARAAAPNLPVAHISQEAAARYARSHGGRFPTAAEFERALRGSGLRTYPWGNAMAAARANLDWGKALGRPVAVGSYPAGASPYGALDLVGNVAEWTSTFAPYGRVGRCPLVLGGSYRDEPAPGLTWRASARPRTVQSDRSRAAWIGFRVVRSAPKLPEK